MAITSPKIKGNVIKSTMLSDQPNKDSINSNVREGKTVDIHIQKAETP